MAVNFRVVVQGALLQVFVVLASWAVAIAVVHGARIQEVAPWDDHQYKQERSNQIFCNRSSRNSKVSNNKSHKYRRLPNSCNYNSNNDYNSQSHLNNNSDNHNNFNKRRWRYQLNNDNRI